MNNLTEDMRDVPRASVKNPYISADQENPSKILNPRVSVYEQINFGNNLDSEGQMQDISS